MTVFVDCRGLCESSCVADVGFGTDDQGRCTRLVAGRCASYEDRPMVCRLWGSVPEMPCPHGCKPTLSTVEGMVLMVTSLLGREHEEI